MPKPVQLCHIELNVHDLQKSGEFYASLASYLNKKEQNFKPGPDDYGFIFIGDFMLCLARTRKPFNESPFHRKATGLNHLCFRVNSKKEVDQFHKNFLCYRQIPALYKGPRNYPDYGDGYYAVYFEDPDRIKLEIAFYPE